MSAKQQGFTLIELMVAVAIIGILTAVSIPLVSQFREKAFNVAARSDLTNGMTLFELYFHEYNHYPSANVSADNTTQLWEQDANGVGFMWTFSTGVSVINATANNKIDYCIATKHISSSLYFRNGSMEKLSEVAAAKETSVATAAGNPLSCPNT